MNPRRLALKAGMAALGTGLAVGILYLSWTLAGPISTIVYTLTFLVCLSFFPTVIALLGSELPGSTAVGKLHLILGQLAFGRSVLVQRDTEYEWCPAREDAIYIDGEWRDIEDGIENWSVLGWRPFAVARLKEDDTWESERVDTAATRGEGTAADGGTLHRGDYEQVDPPLVDGTGGTWVLDLKRMVTRGVKKIGDVGLIETAEEIMMRDEAKSGRLQGHEKWLPPIVGIMLGVITGYLFMMPG